MSNKIDVELQKIEEKKKKLQAKEKLLREKEKQKRSKRFSLIGKIASRANIDHLDDETLLGAFIEISSSLSSKQKLNEWKISGKSFVPNRNDLDGSPLSVAFTLEPNPETKRLLKDLGFRWNSFRREFYGYGSEQMIRESLKGIDFRIEVLD